MSKLSKRAFRQIGIELWENGKSKKEIIKELEQLGQNKMEAERTFYQITAPESLHKNTTYQQQNTLIKMMALIIIYGFLISIIFIIGLAMIVGGIFSYAETGGTSQSFRCLGPIFSGCGIGVLVKSALNEINS